MSLLQMSVTGGVMILAITVLRALAMNHVPKKTFLALWGAALLRLVLPVSLSSTLSIYSLLGQKTALNVVDVPAAATPALLPGQAVTALPQIDAAPVQTISVWSIVWIAGVVLCAAFFAAVYWKCCREFRMSFPVDNDASRQWLQTHPLRRGICIRQSDQISSPLTFGVLHPVILMPKKTDWNDETALQYVLEHEFVHIRRFDSVGKLLLIAAALFLSAYNERESHEARDSARQVIAQLCDALPTEAGDDEAEPTTLPESLPDVRREMPVKTINGRDYIGVLSIPSLELELPVISQWDYPALKVAPCRYSGSLYQDNLIICAHNYASHFGKLKELQPGDTVLFTDMDEHVVTFQVVERETLNPMDAEGMEAGDWDLTLFTCTIGGQTRVTIRLERVEVFRNPEQEDTVQSEK